MYLNYLPLRFTADVFNGGEIAFEGKAKDLAGKESVLSLTLKELRQQHEKIHVFHASGNTIASVPLAVDPPQIGEPKQFNILADFQLANALARAALFEFLQGRWQRSIAIGDNASETLLWCRDVLEKMQRKGWRRSIR